MTLSMALGRLPKPAQAQHMFIWYSSMKFNAILQLYHELNVHYSCSRGEGQTLSLDRDSTGTQALGADHADPDTIFCTQPA